MSAVSNIRLTADHRIGSPGGAYAVITKSQPPYLLNIFQFVNNSWTAIGKKIKNCDGFNDDNGLAASSDFLAAGVSPDGGLYIGIGNPSYSPVYQTLDNGQSYAAIEHGTNGFQPHVDPHCFAFFNGRVYMGNDGGIYRFSPLSNAKEGQSTWESLNTTSLQTILVRGVAVSPVNPGTMLCGNQDNGVGLRQGSNWAYVAGGDNARVFFDPDPIANGQYLYNTGVSDFKFFFRSDDFGKTWNDKSPADAVQLGANIGDYAPVSFHPGNSMRIAVGIDRVYETRDRGDSWGTGAISPIFSPISGKNTGNPATAISYEANDIIWVAYDNKLFLTVNDGGDGTMKNWTEMSQGTDFGGSIVNITVDPRFPGSIYLGINSGHVWFSNSNGSQWTDLTGNMSGIVLNNIAVVPSPDNLFGQPVIYAATNKGILVCPNPSVAQWTDFNSGLPLCDVKDIQYSPTNKMLVAGLFGRGVYSYTLCFNQNPSIQIGNIQDDSQCPMLPIQGTSERFGVSVSGNACHLGYTVSWKVVGGTPGFGETGTKQEYHLDIYGTASSVQLTATISFTDGLILKTSKTFPVITQQEAVSFRAICRILAESRLKPIAWWLWDKEKMDNNNLRFTNTELARMQNTARQILEMTIKLKKLNQNLKTLKSGNIK